MAGRTLPRSLDSLRDVAACRIGAVGDGVEDWASAHRLGPDAVLWEIVCFRGAYNVGTRYWITAQDGSDPRPVTFPTAAGDGTLEIINGAYDPDTRQLTAFNKGRGIADCGSAETWVWTGESFELLNTAAMSGCVGIQLDHWPTLWRAERAD